MPPSASPRNWGSLYRGDPVKLESWIDSRPYLSGELEGGMRAWWKQTDELIKKFYSEPPLVSALRPNEHKHYLSDYAFASRQRGRRAVSVSANALWYRFSQDSGWLRFAMKFCLDMKPVEREQLIYDILEDYCVNDQGAELPFEARIKLVPEFSPTALCDLDGAGLGNFLLYVTDNLPTVAKTDAPFPNDLFLAKMGLKDAALDLPHSRANRAYQEERILVRDSLILMLAVKLLIKRGDPIIAAFPQGPGAGNLKKDFVPENGPSQRSEQAFRVFQQEQCMECGKTADEANIAKLLYCGACYKIKRIEPYCSRECQVAAFPKHKAAGCGRKLSEVNDLPNFAEKLAQAQKEKEEQDIAFAKEEQAKRGRKR